MTSSDSKYNSFFGLTLDTELRKQLPRYKYHLEAINFITQHWTNRTDSQDISSLIKLLKPKLGNDKQSYECLKACLNELAGYDPSFKCYLQCYPGGAPYTPPPGPTPMDTQTIAGQGDSTNSQIPNLFTPPTQKDHSIANQRLDADGDDFLFKIAENIAATKLEVFCVMGLRMELIEYENLTDGLDNHSKKAIAVLRSWQQKAPTGPRTEHGTKYLPFTRHYLKQALNECKHNDAILALGLES